MLPQPVIHGSGPGRSVVRAEPMPNAPAASHWTTSPGAIEPVGDAVQRRQRPRIPARLAGVHSDAGNIFTASAPHRVACHISVGVTQPGMVAISRFRAAAITGLLNVAR